MESIYYHLINYTLPFALEHSELEDHEVLDYIHDFYLDLQDNQVRWVNGVRKGIYHLEKLCSHKQNKFITKFFFQYVTRAKYIEGGWVDRRLLGRITQREDMLGCDLTPNHIPPQVSYEMHLDQDIERFLDSLSDVETALLIQRLNGESKQSLIDSGFITYKKYHIPLASLQKKAIEML